MAKNIHTISAEATDFHHLAETAKADRAYWALDRACAGEALLPGDNAALLYAMGLVDSYAQALRAAGQPNLQREAA